MHNTSPRNVAIIGAGPAGIYAADLLLAQAPEVQIDLFEKLPAPYGLVRYGVSPDHPRIKKIQETLHEVLDNPRIRLRCNVEVGVDVTIEQLRGAYDAVILSTGADRDADLGIPGEQLQGSFGGADFVAWYDGHPDAPVEWPLQAQSVAVIGAGNVALDVARMLIKHADQLEHTDIPPHVARGLAENPITDLHMFVRRGPADVRFSPMELRELGAQHDVDVIVDPVDMELDDHAQRMVKQFSQRRLLVRTMTEWSEQDQASLTGSRRVHFHFYQQPARVHGDHQVTTLEVERMTPDEHGRVTGSGEFEQYDVGAVYRTIGYRSSPVPGVPFNAATGTIPEKHGRVLDETGDPIAGVYVTGWIRRGAIGLIGSTKSDAAQTVASVLEDLSVTPVQPGDAAQKLCEQLTDSVDWEGWLQIDAAERALGAANGRERTKIVSRTALLSHARAKAHTLDEGENA